MFWHVETDFICLMILCTLHYDIRRRDFSSPEQDCFFRSMVGYAIFSAIVDIATCVVLEMPIHALLSMVVVAVYFALLPSFPLVWLYYTWCVTRERDAHNDSTIILLLATVPFFAYVLFALASPLFDLVFTLGDDFRYIRGPYFWGCFHVFFGYNIATVALAFARREKLLAVRQLWILLSFPAVTALGVWAQLSYPGMLTITAAYTVVLVAAYYHILDRRSAS